jgi:hypothetical protein
MQAVGHLRVTQENDHTFSEDQKHKFEKKVHGIFRNDGAGRQRKFDRILSP